MFSSTTLMKQFEDAVKKDYSNDALLAFFQQLCTSDKLRKNWKVLLECAKKNKADETLEFFADYVAFVAKPTKKKWCALYCDWIDMSRDDNHAKININDDMMRWAKALDKVIATCADKKLTLDKLMVVRQQEGSQEPQTLSAKVAIDNIAKYVLGVFSGDPYQRAGIITALAETKVKEDKKIRKETEKVEKKEKKEKNVESTTSSRGPGFGRL